MLTVMDARYSQVFNIFSVKYPPFVLNRFYVKIYTARTPNNRPARTFPEKNLSSNEPDTVELPCYKDGDTTVTLPVITPEDQAAVRPPDRSGATVVVGSELYRDDNTPTAPPYGHGDTARLPIVQPRLTLRRLVQPLTGSRLVKGLLASNALVLCMGLGLFIGGLLVANEAGVIPNSVKPDILKSDPTPAKTPQHKEPMSPTTSVPSNRHPVAVPTAPSSKRKHSSPAASMSPSASVSTSPSASVSASAQPETSPPATAPSSPETTAPTTTSSASAPAPAESSTTGSEPTSSAPPATAEPPTNETASASPATADPSVNP